MAESYGRLRAAGWLLSLSRVTIVIWKNPSVSKDVSAFARNFEVLRNSMTISSSYCRSEPSNLYHPVIYIMVISCSFLSSAFCNHSFNFLFQLGKMLFDKATHIDFSGLENYLEKIQENDEDDDEDMNGLSNG